MGAGPSAVSFTEQPHHEQCKRARLGYPITRDRSATRGHLEERAANPCIGAERADLVLAGCAILDAIRRAFPCQRLRVADRGLREGMLVEMMREDGVWGEA